MTSLIYFKFISKYIRKCSHTTRIQDQVYNPIHNIACACIMCLIKYIWFSYIATHIHRSNKQLLELTVGKRIYIIVVVALQWERFFLKPSFSRTAPFLPAAHGALGPRTYLRWCWCRGWPAAALSPELAAGAAHRSAAWLACDGIFHCNGLGPGLQSLAGCCTPHRRRTEFSFSLYSTGPQACHSLSPFLQSPVEKLPYS